MVPYVSFTSLIAVSSGETTTDMEAADWAYWIRTTVLESRNVDSNVATPQKFHTIAVTLPHALQQVFPTFLHSYIPLCLTVFMLYFIVLLTLFIQHFSACHVIYCHHYHFKCKSASLCHHSFTKVAASYRNVGNNCPFWLVGSPLHPPYTPPHTSPPYSSSYALCLTTPH